MKLRARAVLPVVVLLASAAAAALIVVARPRAVEKPRPAPTPLVRAMEVHPQDVQLVVRTHGTVTPRTEIDVVPEISGRVVEVAPAFTAGGFFEKDDVLFRIDARDYELAVTSAEAAVAQARVALAREQAEAEVARKEWSQLQGGQPPPLVVREPQLAEARAKLSAAVAELDKAKLDLERTKVTAPFAGRVREESLDLGQFVTRGEKVGRVYSVDVAEVRLPLPDDQLAYLDLPLTYRDDDDGSLHYSGPLVRLSTEFAGRRYSWEGRIVRTEGELDPRSRMVHAVAEVADPYGRDGGSEGDDSDALAEGDERGDPGALDRDDPTDAPSADDGTARRPPLAVGLFVDADIMGHLARGVYVVPRVAMRGKDRVLVVDDEDRLRFRDVGVLRFERDHAVIESGLQPGERVCVSPLEVAVDGMQVRVAPSDSAGDAPADEDPEPLFDRPASAPGYASEPRSRS